MPPDSSAQPQETPPPPSKGHEESDVQVTWIFACVLLLFVGGVAIHLALTWQLRHLKKSAPPTDQWTAPRGRGGVPATAGREFPRLQISPATDLAALRAREQAVLNSYGWINETAGVVRIPVQRAMDVIVQKNLLPVSRGTNGLKLGKSPLELQRERALANERKVQP
jgi:hypothetical protein